MLLVAPHPSRKGFSMRCNPRNALQLLLDSFSARFSTLRSGESFRTIAPVTSE